jgi:transposase InsO family protein
MPWKESQIMDERMNFVMRVQAGERVSDLCREAGISRKTGYKFLDRYKRFGPQGLHDETRKPITSPTRYSKELSELVLKLKREKPTWGSDKLLAQLRRRHGQMKLPSRSTIYALLDRHGLVNKNKRKRTHKGQGTLISETNKPNELWCADYKGEFRLGNGRYCYPLTISDHYSRFIIGCQGLENNKTAGAKIGFVEAFEEYGLPDAILSDNGSPFGSVGLFGFSQLSVWWIRLGIKIQRIKPGHPEQNGRHERMHLTLKQNTARPSGANFLQQQEKFDNFKKEFNNERPHDALAMKYPAEIFKSSKKKYPKELLTPEYPLHDLSKNVTATGVVVFNQTNRFHLSQAFCGQRIGLREEEAGLWRVTFVNYDLGYYDEAKKCFTPFDTPQVSTG